MKYILKIDESKVKEIRAKMHESHKGLLVVTLTNLGTQENPAFRVHSISSENIVDLGVWGADRILEQATKVNYNAPSYFGISENSDGTPATNKTVDNSTKRYFMRSVVELLSLITRCKVVRVSEII